jgi:hypothetical protein
VNLVNIKFSFWNLLYYIVVSAIAVYLGIHSSIGSKCAVDMHVVMLEFICVSFRLPVLSYVLQVVIYDVCVTRAVQ